MWGLGRRCEFCDMLAGEHLAILPPYAEIAVLGGILPRFRVVGIGRRSGVAWCSMGRRGGAGRAVGVAGEFGEGIEVFGGVGGGAVVVEIGDAGAAGG